MSLVHEIVLHENANGAIGRVEMDDRLGLGLEAIEVVVPAREIQVGARIYVQPLVSSRRLWSESHRAPMGQRTNYWTEILGRSCLDCASRTRCMAGVCPRKVLGLGSLTVTPAPEKTYPMAMLFHPRSATGPTLVDREPVCAPHPWFTPPAPASTGAKHAMA